jgi:hypothetical protein
MKSKFKKISLLLAGACLLLSGCTGTPVTLKSFSAKEIVQENSRPISAEACGFQLLLFIPINTNSRLERAFTELQKKADNDHLADLSIEEYWRYAFVGTLYCTKLEAIAYQKTASN